MTEARDLLIRDATLPDGRTGQDLLILAGRIAAVGPALAAPPMAPSLRSSRATASSTPTLAAACRSM